MSIKSQSENPKKCESCNLQKLLHLWYDANLKKEILLCESCIFLKEFEYELISDIENSNNQEVLSDYEAFGYRKNKDIPYKCCLYIILLNCFSGKEFTLVDDLIEKCHYKRNNDIIKDIIPQFVKWEILEPPTEIKIEEENKLIVRRGSFFDNLMKITLKKTQYSGKIPNMSKILKIVEGRISFGIETSNTYKDRIRHKLMQTALLNGFEKNGKMKNNEKVFSTNHFKCTICNEESDFRSFIFQHIIKNHPEIDEKKLDDYVKEEKNFAGLKVPKDKIIKIEELKTYGSRFRNHLINLFKREAFFDTETIMDDNNSLIISAPWAQVMEKVNIKVKDLIKAKEKEKSI